MDNFVEGKIVVEIILFTMSIFDTTRDCRE